MRKEILTNIEDLNRYLMKIEKIFPTKDLLSTDFDKKKIKSYYKNSSSGYKFFHSKEGAFHMALNYDGVFNKEGYLTQVKETSSLITEKDTSCVLELGCGKGFNSIFLAKQFPNIKFIGIDISQENLLVANKKSRSMDNVSFSYGDYHNLEFKNESFDLIFEIESICYADQRKVLQNSYDKLKQNAIFVLYDGFKMDGFENLSEELKIAAKLVEKSMAVNNTLEIGEWLKIASEIGFKIKSCENISWAMMPNIGKFQILARGYFKYPFLSKLLLTFLPREMVMNSIAGLLMPFTVSNHAQGYYKIILEK
ncbi:MAG: class I SAM-dependent methyltransferase [Erysipelotrichaceae bacterium]